MVNFAIFNELSLPLGKDAQKNFVQLFKLLEELKINGINQIRMSEDFKDYPIQKDITFQQYLGQRTGSDHDFRSRLISFVTNSVVKIQFPIIEEKDLEQMDMRNNTEYFYNGKNVDGLGCCDIWDTLAVSFNSDPKWDTDNVVIQKKETDKNARISEQCVNIKHASTTVHLKAHQDFFDELQGYIRKGITPTNFWGKKDELFPKTIRFCPEVKEQVIKLDRIVFNAMVRLLQKVEMGKKQITDYRYSGESQTVLNNPQMRKQRTFTIDGKKEFFENHVKSFSKGYRLYFKEHNSYIYIGYIGPHP